VHTLCLWHNHLDHRQLGVRAPRPSQPEAQRRVATLEQVVCCPDAIYASRDRVELMDHIAHTSFLLSSAALLGLAAAGGASVGQNEHVKPIVNTVHTHLRNGAEAAWNAPKRTWDWTSEGLKYHQKNWEKNHKTREAWTKLGVNLVNGLPALGDAIVKKTLGREN